MRFVMHNTEWNVESYDKSKDPESHSAPQFVWLIGNPVDPISQFGWQVSKSDTAVCSISQQSHFADC